MNNYVTDTGKTGKHIKLKNLKGNKPEKTLARWRVPNGRKES
jgi:hypothetical protein